jgi:hypothetical protein
MPNHYVHSGLWRSDEIKGQWCGFCMDFFIERHSGCVWWCLSEPGPTYLEAQLSEKRSLWLQKRIGGETVRLRFVFAVLIVISLTSAGNATVILDSGLDTFAPTGTQFGRISRDGTASTWGSAKVFPGVTGAPTGRGYEVFVVDSGLFPFLQISLDDPQAALFVAAYSTPYAPVNAAPNYGLDVNYLGDPGSSQPFGNPSFFQIEVAQHTQVVLPVNEISPGQGTGVQFDLIVEGFLDASYGDLPEAPPQVPEPGSLTLLAVGVATLIAGRVRNSRRAA